MQQFLIVYLLLIFVHSANSHGRLIYPASRNALWRFGFKALKNRNDNQLNCGGFDIQWKKNLGKCGVCGDPFHLKAQPHIFPGKYAKAVITKEYSRGQEIVVGVELTSNHQGWFEFRIGDIGQPPITQEKLKYLLHPVGIKGKVSRFYLPRVAKDDIFIIKLKLPDALICKHCVIQWWYNTGNSFGCDQTGCGVGKGQQETFVNCADVRITPIGGPMPTLHPNAAGAQLTSSPSSTSRTSGKGKDASAVLMAISISCAMIVVVVIAWGMIVKKAPVKVYLLAKTLW